MIKQLLCFCLGLLVVPETWTSELPSMKVDIEIKESGNIIYGRIDGIATDSQNNIYALDGKNKVIYKYDERGNFLKRIGGPGQGPGEFERPCSLCLDPKDNLYVLDQVSRRIEVYNTNSVYQNSIKLLTSPSSNQRRISIDRKGRIYISGFYRSNGLMLAEYSIHGETEQYFDLHAIEYGRNIFGRDDRILQFIAGGAVCFDDDRMYYSYSWPYLIKEMTMDGRELGTATRDVTYSWTPFIFRTDRENGILFGDSTRTESIFLLGDAYLANSIHAVDWEGNSKSVLHISAAEPGKQRPFRIKGVFAVLDIYTKDLKFVRTILFKEDLRIFCSDRKGRVLGVKNSLEGTQTIIRYCLQDMGGEF